MALYAPQDALTHAKVLVKSMPIDTADSNNFKYRVVDYAASLLWTAAPWSWTLGSITGGAIAGGATTLAVTYPADFLYLNKVFIDTTTQRNELKVVSHLENASFAGLASQVWADTANNRIVITPATPTSFSGTAYLQYKKTPPKITSSNYATAGAQIMPDCYFPVLQAGVLWQAYQYADDQRAGSATVDQDGKLQWTQQAGIFYGMIAEMRKAEKLISVYPGQTQERG